jgi:hypothetical protein
MLTPEKTVAAHMAKLSVARIGPTRPKSRPMHEPLRRSLGLIALRNAGFLYFSSGRGDFPEHACLNQKWLKEGVIVVQSSTRMVVPDMAQPKVRGKVNPLIPADA